MSLFRSRWVDEMVQNLKLVDPLLDENEAKTFAEEEYDKHFKDPKAIIYNNYEREQINTSLSKVYDWIETKKPIVTESGSLFKQHSQCYNPDIVILSKLLSDRKIAKKAMFKFKEAAKAAVDPTQRLELLDQSARSNLKQKRLKVIANSEYGVSGLSSSQQFNMACASATTARGQALISCAETAFEDFLADNVLFNNMDECMRFIKDIIEEKSERKFNDATWVRSKTVDQVVDRLTHKFIEPDTADTELIREILSHINQEDLNRIYYKSNLEEFFRHSNKASNLLRTVVASHKEYLDPTKPPKDFEPELAKMRAAVLEYVHYNHPTTDRVYRLKAHMRKRVIVIDTDS